MAKGRRAVIFVSVFAIALMLWLWRREWRPYFSPPAVLGQVRQLNQLSTVKYTIQKVIGLKEQKEPIGSESILLIIQAHIEAGIDLAGMTTGDITVRSDGTVEVRLPRAKILNVSIEEKETKVWDRRITWWTPWVPYSLDLEQRARLAGLEAVKQAALEMGILAQAERNAELSIRGLLTLAGVKQVLIVPGSVS
jgi:hypothetical protein